MEPLYDPVRGVDPSAVTKIRLHPKSAHARLEASTYRMERPGTHNSARHANQGPSDDSRPGIPASRQNPHGRTVLPIANWVSLAVGEKWNDALRKAKPRAVHWSKKKAIACAMAAATQMARPALWWGGITRR